MNGLVLEGGAMRGMFTAGALDVMMESGLTFDGAAGVSAGAVFGCNIKSRQIGRVIRYNKRFCRDWRYGSFRSLILTGDLYNARFCYDTLPYELDLFDTPTYRNNPMSFYVVTTDMSTGTACYHDCRVGDGEDMQWFRASASLPVVSRPVILEGKPMSDGGASDPIPIRFLESKGYDRNVVLLTQPAGFVKKQLSHFGMIKRLLRKWPEEARALENRPDLYNETTRYVAEAEAAGRAFVIRPPEPLGIGSTCRDPEDLERVYRIGRRTCEAVLPELRAFLQ